MDEKSTDVIKPNDIELSHLADNPLNMENPLPSNPPTNDSNFKISPSNQQKPVKLNTKPFMPIPKRIVILSLVLFIIGSSFLISGLIDYFQADRERGIAFIVFGSLMFIPGLFYTYQVYLACVAGTPEERQEILEDIPQIDY